MFPGYDWTAALQDPGNFTCCCRSKLGFDVAAFTVAAHKHATLNTCASELTLTNVPKLPDVAISTLLSPTRGAFVAQMMRNITPVVASLWSEVLHHSDGIDLLTSHSFQRNKCSHVQVFSFSFFLFSFLFLSPLFLSFPFFLISFFLYSFLSFFLSFCRCVVFS